MAKKKKRSDKSKRLWRIFITAVGAALVLIAAVQLALYFFGASAPADVTVRRQGGADDGGDAEPALRVVARLYVYG